MNIKNHTMKDLKTTWFIQHPIDQEHKQYVLLDFLKSVNTEISKENIYYPVKKIFSIIKELTFVKNLLEGKNVDPYVKIGRIKKLKECIEENHLSLNEKIECLKIVDSSLAILYKYADLGMSLWRNIEKRIKTFDLFHPDKETGEYGILILRNMSSDGMLAYLWQNGDDMKSVKGTIMKNIPLKNPYFSLSYEFSVHEIMQILGISVNPPRVTVMEISEDFREDSVIVKIAKELFIREISSSKEREI
jgi:hypothetical protein